MRLAKGCTLDAGRHRYTPFHVALARGLAAPAVPARHSIEAFAPEVMDQGPVGSCEGHSTAGAIYTTLNANGAPLPWVPSPLGIYNLALALDRGDPTAGALEDLGTETNTVLRVVHEFGVRPMGARVEGRNSDCDIASALREPLLGEIEADAQQLLIGAYQITSRGAQKLADVKTALASGFAVRVDSFVDMAFEDWQAGDAPFGKPDLNDPNGGGHALYAVAYDGDVVTIRNSWAADWGDGGDIRVSAAFIEQADCFAWSVRRPS